MDAFSQGFSFLALGMEDILKIPAEDYNLFDQHCLKKILHPARCYTSSVQSWLAIDLLVTHVQLVNIVDKDNLV